MIFPHVTDDIDIPPTETGPRGRAWRVDLAAATMARLPGEEHATLALWIVEAPWAHPFWHSYMISLVHLRPMADERPTVVHLEGATHEMLVYAMNPDVSRRPAITGAAYPSLLHPGNFAAQMIELSDEVASEHIRRTVIEIINGGLNPDTDARSQWVRRFGDNMLRSGSSIARRG